MHYYKKNGFCCVMFINRTCFSYHICLLSMVFTVYSLWLNPVVQKARGSQFSRLFSTHIFQNANKERDGSKILSRPQWLERSHKYQKQLLLTIYPKGIKSESVDKYRTHEHPIYNFLHRYYRYSLEYIQKFSPGIDFMLEDVHPEDKNYLHCIYFSNRNDDGENRLWQLDPSVVQIELEKTGGKFRHSNLFHNYQVLKNTDRKLPFYGCFGFHEWAMLYSGKNHPRPAPHQPQLPLRVSQECIDAIVEEMGNLKCTHYDAFRFFQRESQSWNLFPQLTRKDQARLEQPGCIHATMDLFKYAYQLYPFVSSELLLKALGLAIEARKVDMRASPYDCSNYLEELSEGPICVETATGRREYIAHQERLYHQAGPIRQELLSVYETVLSSSSLSGTHL